VEGTVEGTVEGQSHPSNLHLNIYIIIATTTKNVMAMAIELPPPRDPMIIGLKSAIFNKNR
jgi:hypothetical protein